LLTELRDISSLCRIRGQIKEFRPNEEAVGSPYLRGSGETAQSHPILGVEMMCRAKLGEELTRTVEIIPSLLAAPQV
jgi:hypothetical protein